MAYNIYKVFDTYKKLECWYRKNCFLCNKHRGCSILRDLKIHGGHVTSKNEGRIQSDKPCKRFTKLINKLPMPIWEDPKQLKLELENKNVNTPKN